MTELVTVRIDKKYDLLCVEPSEKNNIGMVYSSRMINRKNPEVAIAAYKNNMRPPRVEFDSLHYRGTWINNEYCGTCRTSLYQELFFLCILFIKNRLQFLIISISRDCTINLNFL